MGVKKAIRESRLLHKTTFSESTMAWLLFAAFLLSLLPVLAVAVYSTPRADDFSYGIGAHRAILAGEGFAGALRAAFRNSKSFYFSWQGSYSAIAVFSLMTGIFGTEYYRIGLYLLITSLYIPTFLLIHTLLCRWLKMPKWTFLLLASAMCLSMLWFIPNGMEGFYWFNGVSYYTLFYGLSELLAVLLIYAFLTDKAVRRKILFLLSCVLALIIAGGNLVTGLVVSVLLVFACIASFAKRPDCKWWMLAVCIFMLLGFAVNILAPGNLIRGNGSLGASPVKAVLMSFYQGAKMLADRNRPGTIAMYILMVPVILQAAQKCPWKFRYPIPVIGLAYCVYACQFTPGQYSMNGDFPPRMENIFFYFMHWWILFALFYLFGWLIHSPAEKTKRLNAEAVCAWYRKHIVRITALAAVCFAVGTCCWAPGQDFRTVQPLAATIALARNHPQRTYREFLEMEEILNNASEDDVVYLKELWVNQNVSAGLRIEASEEGADYWINQYMAKYYNVKTVLLKEPENSD